MEVGRKPRRAVRMATPIDRRDGFEPRRSCGRTLAAQADPAFAGIRLSPYLYG
jgi:hypothetical protein